MDSIQDRKFIEKAAISIVREYLLRKDLPETVNTLCNEAHFLPCFNSRSELAKSLKLQELIKANKSSTHPFQTLLEILIQNYLESRPSSKSGKRNSRNRGRSNETDARNRHRRGSNALVNNNTYEESIAASGLANSLKFKEPKRVLISGRNSTPPENDELEEEREKILNESKPIAFGAEIPHQQWGIRSSLEKSTPPFFKKQFPNVLETKQNLLAQVSLTKDEEISRHEKIILNNQVGFDSNPTRAGGESEILQDFDDDIPTPLQFEILEDVEEYDDYDRRHGIPQHLKPTQNESDSSTLKYMTAPLWKELSFLLFGQRPSPQDWDGQGFTFNSKIPYGLIQKKGGPCGVYASIQALLLRNLMFGSEFYEEELFPNITNPDEMTIKKIKAKRVSALSSALTEIIWRCGNPGVVNEKSKEEHGPTICFNHTIGSTIHTFYDSEELQHFIHFNIKRFDCMNVVYSVVLSRGIQNVKADMDFNGSLLGQHGYCTQELINLLIIGIATSNAFDNDVYLGEQRLKGISSQADIGFLSLFEHYDSCRVGSFFKSPKFPLWLVCSESHFSLLFSNDFNLATKGDPEKKRFDLYYYDGLALQEWIIRLTISFNAYEPKIVRSSDTVGRPIGNNNSDEDLIPPLDKCIRTKWQNALVDWNETEPIL